MLQFHQAYACLLPLNGTTRHNMRRRPRHPKACKMHLKRESMMV